MSTTVVVKAAGRERRFEYLCDEPYRTTDGRDIELSVWRGSCVICGARFYVKTPSGTDESFCNAFETATCRQHRGMGRPAKRRKKS